MDVINANHMYRRHTLKMIGVSGFGAARINYVGMVDAQSSKASVSIEDQETDGDTIVLEDVQTDVESQLMIISDEQVDGSNINYRTIGLDPGTDVTDQGLELSDPILETQEIRAEIWKGDEYEELLARDNALITIEEPGDDEQVDPIPSDPAVELIDADGDAGFHFSYLLYTPSVDDETVPRADETRPLFVRCIPLRGGDFGTESSLRIRPK